MVGYFSESNFADIMGVSKSTVQKWIANGTYNFEVDDCGNKYFAVKDLLEVPEVSAMVNSKWSEEMLVTPLRDYTSIELFAGAGGMAIGMEKAGFKHVMLNEIMSCACKTLLFNRPNWNVVEGDIPDISFEKYAGKVDFISGGFPCQAF